MWEDGIRVQDEEVEEIDGLFGCKDMTKRR